MAFTAKDVQTLRERTGCGMMDCKKTLTEADGDMEKAIELLREKGLAAAAKKAGRIAAEGVVFAVIDGKKGAIIEVNSETDFVAKNDGFRAFVNTCAEVVIADAPADVDALLACKVNGTTIDAMLKEKILTIGENLKIRRFKRYEGVLVAYIHGGGTHAVLVKFDTDDATAAKPEFALYAKDIAMQIAAANPGYLCKDEVPDEDIAKEKEILTQQAINEGKPANIAEK
ncbi:MAG: translation elongation factor Ts, partial [Oscillospiraceae bacterium]